MRACCSNLKCAKEFTFNYITTASKSKCDICGSELLIEHKTGYKNIWLSPNIALIRFKNVVTKFGIEQAVKNIKFKHEREAWVSAIWALGMSSISGKEYWIEIEIEENTPDTYVYYLDVVKGNNHRRVFNVEVMDWEDHENDLVKLLAKKCFKQYPRYFTLLTYARNPKVKVDLDAVFNEAQKLKVPFGQIWLIGETKPGLFKMVKLYPDKDLIEFELKSIQEKHKNQIGFSTFLKRGTGSEPEDLGKLYLPIPTL